MASAKTFLALFVLFLVASVGLPGSARAEDKAPVDIDDLPLKPAPIGAPQSTIGAGARSGSDGLPDVFVLVPSSTGDSCKTQPTVYWYLTGDTDWDIEIVVARVSDAKKISTKTLPGGRKAGIHAFNFVGEKDLANQPLVLQQDMQYKLTVTVKAFDEDTRNPHSTGLIAPVARPAALGEHPDAKEYAAAGLWYDAVESLLAELSKNPSSVPARRQLCGLVWSQHIFCVLSEKKVDAAALQRAKDEERKRMKEFDAVKWDQVK